MANTSQNPDSRTERRGFHKPKKFAVLLAVFLFIKLSFALAQPNRQLIQASDLTIENIMTAVNQQRSLRNLVTLNTNLKLSGAAQSKTDDMQARHYFAHVDPDGHYIWDKIVASGYTPYLQLGENLAIEFFDTDSLISAWMNSPTHRANVLQEGFRDQGMGVTFGDENANQYHSAIANTFGTLVAPPKAKPATPKQAVKPTTNIPAKAKPVAIKPKPASNAPLTTKPKPVVTKTSVHPIAAIPARATPPLSPVKIAEQTQSAPPPTPIHIRGANSESTNPNSNFALPQAPNQDMQQNSTATSKKIQKTSTPLDLQESAAPGVVGSSKQNSFENVQFNRYLALICGFTLLIFLLIDIRSAFNANAVLVDKKTNSLALLIISIIVVAFMYWM